jgi:hypothetical protein
MGMPLLNIGNASASNLTNNVSDITVDPVNPDLAGDQKESSWQNSKWTQQWGYFTSVPEFNSAMIMKAIWTVGKGYTCEDSETKVILENIRGIGCDTFGDILFNMELIKRVGGDSYSEIIRDEGDGTMLNLKPLDPGTMKIIYDDQGIIKRYEQTIGKGSQPIKFNPEEIFHLSHNRLGAQIHGISDTTAIEKTLLAEYENFEDMKKIMHRQARPLVIFKLKTDDTTKIAQFISKMDGAMNKGEEVYIPDDENMLSYEIVQIDVSNTIMAWRTDIKNKFYRAVGLPQVIFGSSGATESGGKIEYLAHEQVFAKEQLYLENQIYAQLNLKIKLIPPTTLLENMQNDENKDGNSLAMQPNDMIAGSGK